MKSKYTLTLHNAYYDDGVENDQTQVYSISLSTLRQIEDLLSGFYENCGQTFDVTPIEKRKLKKRVGLKTEDKPIVNIDFDGFDYLIKMLDPDVKCKAGLKYFFDQNFDGKDMIINKEMDFYIERVTVPKEQIESLLK